MNTDFNILLGMPKKGQKITYKEPTKFCFHTDVLENEKKLLELEKEYTVQKVSVNSSSTYVVLEEFYDPDLDEYRNNQITFNLHAFEWETPEFNPDDIIGFDMIMCKNLMRPPYEFGLKYLKEHYIGKGPTLVMEYDEEYFEKTKQLIVKKAYFE